MFVMCLSSHDACAPRSVPGLLVAWAIFVGWFVQLVSYDPVAHVRAHV
jgi:hypothetical protein